jgi:rhodanese-related sulfurtransferase
MKDIFDPNELRRLMAEGATVLNVLPRKEYETVHIKGSDSLPLKQLDPAAVGGLDRNAPIVVYCHDFQ